VAGSPLVVERRDPSKSDVIIAIDGRPVKTAAAFLEKIEEHQPGEQVVLTIIRQGRQLQVPVTLGAS
jgi:S1-C subfamily serine protease